MLKQMVEVYRDSDLMAEAITGAAAEGAMAEVATESPLGRSVRSRLLRRPLIRRVRGREHVTGDVSEAYGGARR